MSAGKGIDHVNVAYPRVQGSYVFSAYDKLSKEACVLFAK